MTTDEVSPRAAERELERDTPAPQRASPVAVGPDGDVVWRPLRDAWLTHRIVAAQDTHVKGGYAWNASKYLPVVVIDEDGDPFLSFSRH